MNQIRMRHGLIHTEYGQEILYWDPQGEHDTCYIYKSYATGYAILRCIGGDIIDMRSMGYCGDRFIGLLKLLSYVFVRVCLSIM